MILVARLLVLRAASSRLVSPTRSARFRRGGRRVTPSPLTNVPLALARGAEITYAKDLYLSQNEGGIAWLEAVNGASFFFPADQLCGPDTCSLVDAEGRPSPL